MRIHYYSHAGRETGYGRAARGYQMGLLSIKGVTVDDLSLSDLGSELADDAQADVVVHHGTPAQLVAILAARGGNIVKKPTVAVTTWETSIFPAHYAKALKQYYQAIIVPSRFCARIVADSIHATTSSTSERVPKTYMVPHAFEPGEWLEADKPKRDDGAFTFYTIGAWSERKNVAGVIRAYLSAFDKSDKTRLVVISDKANFDVIRGLIARSGLPKDELPGLLVPDRTLSNDEIYRLHLESDCFVSAARCEGFGLGMFEAMVMGRPVISSGYGGQEDFLDDYPGWYKISHQLTPVFAGEGEVVVHGEQIAGSITLPRGANARQLWAEPNLAQMVNRMQDVWRDLYVIDSSDREELEDRYSTTVIGQSFYSVLEKVLS